MLHGFDDHDTERDRSERDELRWSSAAVCRVAGEVKRGMRKSDDACVRPAGDVLTGIAPRMAMT